MPPGMSVVVPPIPRSADPPETRGRTSCRSARTVAAGSRAVRRLLVLPTTPPVVGRAVVGRHPTAYRRSMGTHRTDTPSTYRLRQGKTAYADGVCVPAVRRSCACRDARVFATSAGDGQYRSMGAWRNWTSSSAPRPVAPPTWPLELPIPRTADIHSLPCFPP